VGVGQPTTLEKIMRGAEAKSRLEAEAVASEAAVAMFGLVAGVGPGFRGLADQATRAVTSVPLNLAEGNGRFGRDRVQHFRIAYGSAKEASAALRLLVGTKAVPVEAGQAVLEALDRVQAMTWRLMFGRR
jgi:four helix bundle protein